MTEQAKPPDGAISTCRRCSNDIRYNAGRQRWEHTGHGNWECFQPQQPDTTGIFIA